MMDSLKTDTIRAMTSLQAIVATWLILLMLAGAALAPSAFAVLEVSANRVVHVAHLEISTILHAV